MRNFNEKLRFWGLKINFLSLERNQQDPLPAESLKTQINIDHSIDGLPSIIIKNIVLMNIQDVSRYIASGSPELIGWLEGQFEKLINQELISAQFADLVIDFQPFAERIRHSLSLAAPAIGYNIVYLKSTREVEPDEWLEGIEFKTDDSDEEFETSVSNFFIKLSFSLTVRVKDLKGIKPLLEQRQHVPTLMERALLDSIRRLLRETHPKQFYTRFSRSGTEDEPAFEDRLKKRLSDMLEKEFSSEIVEAIFKNGETKITRVLEELQRERCEFKILIPRNRRNAEDCIFRGYFKVNQVDCNGWEEFQRTLPNIDKVKEHLEAGIKTALENHPTALMTFRDTLNLNEVLGVAEQAAQSTILNDFGLSVTITNLGSDAVESEKKIAESTTKARTESVEKELKRYFSITTLATQLVQELEQEMVRVKSAGGPKEAIDDIQRRIEALKSHTPTEPLISELSYENLRGSQ
jgi:hypothetical protein